MIKACKFPVIIFLTCLTISQTNGQEVCVPSSVVNLAISNDAVVSWEANPNEECDVNLYMVYIDSDVGTEYTYAVSQTTLSVEFLPICDSYTFRVAAISSDNVVGDEISLTSKIPLPEGTNLTVANVRAFQQEGSHELFLEWSMDDEWVKCADRFRVIIHDEQIDYIQDIYTFNTSISIPDMAPCTSYELGVAAIYNIVLQGPVSVIKHETPADTQPAPKFSGIVLGMSGVILTWNLESYARNKCPLTKAELTIVDHYYYTLDLHSNTNRQPFNMTLTYLRADTLYVANVSVFNSAGSSPNILLGFQTLPSS